MFSIIQKESVPVVMDLANPSEGIANGSMADAEKEVPIGAPEDGAIIMAPLTPGMREGK